MRNLFDKEDEHDYRPNELARMKDKEKSDEIIRSNLNEWDTVERWKQRNLERAQKLLSRQRVFLDLDGQ